MRKSQAPGWHRVGRLRTQTAPDQQGPLTLESDGLQGMAYSQVGVFNYTRRLAWGAARLAIHGANMKK